MMPMRAGSTAAVLRLQHVDGRHHVVHFSAAVIDRVVERLPVADAAAILRCDDDIALRGCLADVWNVVFVEVAADVLVDPDERGVRLRAAELQRLEDKCRDVEIAYAAAIGDLLHLHDAVARGAPGPVRVRLLLQHSLEVGLPLTGSLRRLTEQRYRTQPDERCECCDANRRADHPDILHRPSGTGRGARMRAREPAAKLIRGLDRRGAVERHQRGRDAGDADDVGTPPVLGYRDDFNQVRAAGDRLFETMHR